MWWPSFVSVMQDLWQFVLGYRATTIDASSDNALMRVPDRSLIEVFSNQPGPVRLVPIVHYEASHADVTRIRQVLCDYDRHLVEQADLSEREWLLYYVHTKRPSLALLALWLTPIGSWHVTLKGQPGITIGVVPYTGAIMEWRTEPSKGRVALVVEVSPDETITIGELGSSESGVYTKRALTKDQWHELRPVFTTLV